MTIVTRLFIDDIRMPAEVGWNDADFIIARTPMEARYLINKHKPQFIAFDHDLGMDEYTYEKYDTGYDIAKWIVRQDNERGKNYITSEFDFSVHSANPIGAENIYELLTNYIEFKRSNNDKPSNDDGQDKSFTIPDLYH